MKRSERPKNKYRRYLTAILLSAGLALGSSLLACTSTKDADARAGAAKPGASEPRSPKLNRLDACALLSKAEVEQTLKQSVTSVDPERASEGSADTAASSQCSYKTVASQTVELFARRSPVADNSAEAIQRVRDTMKEITQKEPAEVKGLGDTAFWTAGRQLHVFAGGNLYFYVSMMNFKDEADARAKAAELARLALAKLTQ